MDHRAELVRLITAGTPPPDIVEFFLRNGLQRGEVDMLLHDCDVQFWKRQEYDDGISDQRRRELQELSTSED